MRRFACFSVFMVALASTALAMQDSQIPTKFPIPWGNSAGVAYIHTIPQSSQIGIQNCAASLTDGFPPLTFVPSGAGGCAPLGQDFNGILKQITQWIQWYTAGGPLAWDSAFSASIGGYPKGAIISSATFGQLWLNTVENNSSNPDTGGAGWQNYYVGWTGVTAGTYSRAKITVAADGKLTAASAGITPTYKSICAAAASCSINTLSGTVTPTAGVTRWKVRMIGGGGGGGGASTAGTLGNPAILGGWVATGGGGGGAAGGGGGSAGAGGTGGANGTGTLILRLPGANGQGGMINNAGGAGSITFTTVGGTGPFGGQGAGANAAGGAGGFSSVQVATGQISAGGGGAAEYVEFIVPNPAGGGLSYSIGVGGTGGTSIGGGNVPGGIGQGSLILIEEFYD